MTESSYSTPTPALAPTLVPTSSLIRITIVINAKIEVEKFDGGDNFGLWQCEVIDNLYQWDLDIALEEKKLEKIKDKDWERINC